ncbi:Hpt domain-containing protein [Winogradskyella sp. A2]|uniref:Hpt domain-containing protein n=1 Tax=Winogradskyella sp. A2 TaxID=3366944 RepID=UPI00398C7C26
MEQPNLSYIHSMSGGNKDFEQKLIGIIKQEFPLEKQEYIDNITAKNYKLAANNVHKLKHKISILGLEKSYEVAVNYEDNLIDHKTDGQDDFETILQIMTDFLKTL